MGSQPSLFSRLEQTFWAFLNYIASAVQRYFVPAPPNTGNDVINLSPEAAVYKEKNSDNEEEDEDVRQETERESKRSLSVEKALDSESENGVPGETCEIIISKEAEIKSERCMTVFVTGTVEECTHVEIGQKGEFTNELEVEEFHSLNKEKVDERRAVEKEENSCEEKEECKTEGKLTTLLVGEFETGQRVAAEKRMEERNGQIAKAERRGDDDKKDRETEDSFPKEVIRKDGVSEEVSEKEMKTETELDETVDLEEHEGEDNSQELVTVENREESDVVEESGEDEEMERCLLESEKEDKKFYELKEDTEIFPEGILREENKMKDEFASWMDIRESVETNNEPTEKTAEEKDEESGGEWRDDINHDENVCELKERETEDSFPKDGLLDEEDIMEDGVSGIVKEEETKTGAELDERVDLEEQEGEDKSQELVTVENREESDVVEEGGEDEEMEICLLESEKEDKKLYEFKEDTEIFPEGILREENKMKDEFASWMDIRESMETNKEVAKKTAEEKDEASEGEREICLLESEKEKSFHEENRDTETSRIGFRESEATHKEIIQKIRDENDLVISGTQWRDDRIHTEQVSEVKETEILQISLIEEQSHENINIGLNVNHEASEMGKKNERKPDLGRTEEPQALITIEKIHFGGNSEVFDLLMEEERWEAENDGVNGGEKVAAGLEDEERGNGKDIMESAVDGKEGPRTKIQMETEMDEELAKEENFTNVKEIHCHHSDREMQDAGGNKGLCADTTGQRGAVVVNEETDGTVGREYTARDGVIRRRSEKRAHDAEEEEFNLQLDSPSLDFAAQKSRIALKNRQVRPPKDPRLLQTPSLSPTSTEPILDEEHKSKPVGIKMGGVGKLGIKLPAIGDGPKVLRKAERREEEKGEDGSREMSLKQPTPGVNTDNGEQAGAEKWGSGSIGVKLPGFGPGMPVLRKTGKGVNLRGEEPAEDATSSGSGTERNGAESLEKEVKSIGASAVKLPSFGTGFPVLRKTEMGLKIRGEDSKEKSEAVWNTPNVQLGTRSQHNQPENAGSDDPLLVSELKKKIMKLERK